MSNEVVISGIGSAFSGSGNVEDFGRDLLDNKHLVERTKRWRDDVFTPVCGQTPHEYFDELFFGINRKLAVVTDPSSKIGYMRSFEAILDAGLHPAALSGSNTGVFACSGINEFEQKIIYSTAPLKDGYAVMGLSRTMLPNRLSYYFNFNGPSCAVDGSWVGGLLGLKQAAAAIREGRCDAALVVAGSISRYGETSLLLNKLGLVTDEGVTRSFDAKGTGAVRSDGSVAMLLQRADQAKRCYARVLATEVEFVGPRCNVDLTLPSPKGTQDFLRRTYKKHAIDPKTIAYLEADGNGNRIRDACELNAIDQALVQKAARPSPLQIGSVKSNIGHVDCVNGLAAICKMVVAMETGVIPATINFQEPNSKATGLVAGRLKVVDKNTPLHLSEDSVLAVHTMAVSSMIGHAVLGGNSRGPCRVQDPADHLPRLVTFSARDEEAAADVANKIQSAPFDTNYYRLLQDVFSDDIRGHNYRGFVICPSTGNDTVIAPLEKKAVWFVYSGMGSQWAGMGSALMKLPVFAETIERLHAVLEPRGVDLKTILTETGPTAFDNILKSFVGITACQIALTNVLTAVGVVPDGMVGHSVGELGCAYADGCLTEEQAILAAFARGKASSAVPLIKGKMAAIGLGYQDVLPRLPPTIDVACHNSSTSCTLSGPAQDVDSFVRKLSDEGVFARAVNVSDIAYHSRYIQPAAPHLLQHLKEVIPEPKPRSARWLTTSVPVDKRDSELAKFCSAEYQTNNLLSPVLFEEALQFIPTQAVLIEVAPHGLLQAILKRALPDNVHIPLTQRGHADPLRLLLAAIGRTSFASVSPKVSSLYPDVDFPVPRGTPSLAPLVLWSTDESLNNDIMHLMENWIQAGTSLKVPFHVKVGRSRFYPLSEELVVMYESALARKADKDESYHVSLQDILVKQWMPISPNDDSFLEAHFMAGTSETQLVYIDENDKPRTALQGHTKVTVSGSEEEPPALPALELEKDAIELVEDDVYQELAARGLEYTDKYKTIKSIRMGHRDWLVSVAPNGSLSATIEAVLQVYILKAIDESQELRLPRKIRRLDIDPATLKNKTEVTLRLELATGILAGAGVYASGVTLQELPPALRVESLPTPELLPLGETSFQTPEEFVRMAVNVALMGAQDQGAPQVTFLELPNGKKTAALSTMVLSATRAAGYAQARVVALAAEGTIPPGFRGRVLLLVTGPTTMAEAMQALDVGLADALLVWSTERLVAKQKRTASVEISIVAQQQCLIGEWLTLVRRAQPLDKKDTVVVHLDGKTPLPRHARPTTTVVLVSQTDPSKLQQNIQETLKKVEALPYAAQARLVFIEDEKAPPFDVNKELHQLARGFRVNVLREGGVWSTPGPAMHVRKPCALSTALAATSLGDVRLQFLGVTSLSSERDVGPTHLDYVGVLENGAEAVRVMGVGRWLPDDRVPQLDPVLRWPVPASWSTRDAATVPFVYALVYHALQVQAGARRGESILVHEGASAVGQAAIRVACQLGCAPLYTTVANSRERAALLAMFPQLQPAQVLSCGDGGSFEPRLRLLTRGRGVRLVVNTLAGSEFRASLRCIGYFGRLINFSREDLQEGNIGSQMFLLGSAVFGCSGSELFHATEDTRLLVVEAVAKGIRDGVVQPIVGAEDYSSHRSIGDLRRGTKAVVKVDSMALGASRVCDPNKCYIVVGCQAVDALFLASRLAVLGARHILAVVGSSPSSPLVRQRQRALRRQLGAGLQVLQVREWTPAAAESVLKVASSVAPVHRAVVVVKSENEQVAAALLGSALQPSMGLVLLADRDCLAAPLVALAEQRQSLGWPTSCLAASLGEASERLGDLLHNSSLEVLPSAISDQGAGSDKDLSLSLTVDALAALSRADSQRSRLPRMVELTSLGPASHSSRENRNLFVLPPLSVLDPTSKSQLAGLAARLFSPVLVVETTPGDSVKVAAKAVVRAVLDRQPHGPYNLLGWRLSTVLALEVQRQLEAAGKRGVLFLVHGDVTRVQQWAEQRLGGDAADGVRDGLVNGEAARAEEGAQVLDELLEAVAAHKSDVCRPFAGYVKIVRTSEDELQSLGQSDKDPHVKVQTLADRSLDSEALSAFINENAAWSQLAGEADLRLAINLASSSL